jgi:hypothetical protein
MRLDNIPIQNKERDKAWETFIKRKDVKAFMKENSDFKFPLDGSYEMWCIAWDKAWATAQGSAQEPKEWAGLTDEEINAIYVQHHNQFGECISGDWGYERDIEAKLKEKNHVG